MRSVLVPLSKFYVNLSGYKKLGMPSLIYIRAAIKPNRELAGLRYDDILMEETVEMQKALSRLTEKEKYDRQYRMKRALMAGVRHENLKPEDHTTSEQVKCHIDLCRIRTRNEPGSEHSGGHRQ